MKIANWTARKTKVVAELGVLELDELEARVDHGLRDEKGRAIGGVATLREYYLRDGRAFVIDPAARWVVFVNATRDGRDYGAARKGTVVATLEQAKSLAARKLIEQRERYAKAAKKVEAAS